MKKIDEIEDELITKVGALLRTEASLHFSMEVEQFIKEFGIPQKMIAERSKIAYTRFRNCMSRDNYSFSDEERSKIKTAIVEWMSEMLKKIVSTQ